MELATATGAETYAVRDADGQEWVFSPIETPALAGEIENYFAGWHRAEQHRTCAGAPADVYARALVLVGREIAGGLWRFGGPAMLEAMTDVQHAAKVMQLALRPRHGAVSEECVKRLIAAHLGELNDMLCTLNPNTFRRAGPDPKAPAPPPPPAPGGAANGAANGTPAKAPAPAAAPTPS